MQNQLGLHETLEAHEILTFKNNCLAKSSTMSALAQDEELKNLLSLDVQQSRQEIEQLVTYLS
jgi:similar to spore coat protein